MAEDRIELDTGTGELLCEIRDRVALITLNRPDQAVRRRFQRRRIAHYGCRDRILRRR